MNRLISTLTVILFPVAAMAQVPVIGPATCEAERAVYEMTAPDTDEVWRIGLVPARNMASIASDLYLKLTTPQRDYWFTFSVSQGYSGISVFPVTDPYADSGPRDLLGPPFGANADGVTDPDILGALRFLTLDAELNIAFEPARANAGHSRQGRGRAGTGWRPSLAHLQGEVPAALVAQGGDVA